MFPAFTGNTVSVFLFTDFCIGRVAGIAADTHCRVNFTLRAVHVVSVLAIFRFCFHALTFLTTKPVLNVGRDSSFDRVGTKVWEILLYFCCFWFTYFLITCCSWGVLFNEKTNNSIELLTAKVRKKKL